MYYGAYIWPILRSDFQHQASLISTEEEKDRYKALLEKLGAQVDIDSDLIPKVFKTLGKKSQLLIEYPKPPLLITNTLHQINR